MSLSMITFRSVTGAQQAQRALQSKGISAVLGRSPGYLESRGCGYCLRLPPSALEKALQQLQSAGITYRKAYLQPQEEGQP